MMRRLVLACALVTVLGLFSPREVKADGVVDTFTLQFAGAGSPTFSWELPASPTISAGDATSTSFVIQDLTYWITGGGSSTWDKIIFYTAGDGGGFAAFICQSPSPCHIAFPLDDFGAQLFTGSTSSPTFAPGTYTLTGDGFTETLIISQTPEPASLLLLGSGALACLGFLRNKIAKRPPPRS